MHFSRSSLALITALLAACGPSSATPDASRGPDVVAAADAQTDGGAADGATARLFAHCGTDADCLGGTCYTTFPGGLCSQPCTTNADCGTGVCITLSGTETVCRPTCTAGGLECDAYGSRCVLNTTGFASEPECASSCSATPPTGTPGCGAGLTCDPFLTGCHATASMGADDGAACATDTDCRSGACFTEVDPTGAPTGWVHGYCMSFSRFPAIASFVPGRPIPAANCPPGSVITPDQTASEGDSVACLHSCTAVTDCRPGYDCLGLHDDSGMTEFSTGVCVPGNCLQPGHACPDGYACQILPGTTGGAGSCVAAAAGDGGVGDGGR